MKLNIYRQILRKAYLTALVVVLGVSLFAANQTSGGNPVKVSGVVKDASGVVVIGASVIEKGTTNGVVTSDKGEYTITVKPNATLSFQYLGMETQEIAIGAKTKINVELKSSAENIDEVVVVGYGTQKKATLTGAVSAIKNDEIMTTKNENVQNMLTGKVAGLRVVQKSSEPGQFNNSLDIRGFGAPIVVVDGVPRNNMSRIDPEDIESISVLKDASAAVYGVRAANGVILITTKKGSKGTAPSISYNGSMTWQKPSNFPETVNAVDWMTLANEQNRHNVDNPTADRFTESQFEEYRDGTKQSTNWRKAVFRETAPQTQHTMSATGGTDAITYYASVGYQYQGSFLQTDAINYEKYTMRSNISAKVAKNLKLDLNLSGFIDERKSSVYSASDIVRGMWLMRPMDQIYYNEAEGQYSLPQNSTLDNPVAMMDTDLGGENSYKSKWFQSNLSMTYDIPQVKGLSLKGMYSYDFTLNDNKEYRQRYNLYNTEGKASVKNSPGTTGPNKVSRYYYGKNATLWYGQLSYDRTFGKHHVSGMALFESSKNDGDNFYGSRFAVFNLDQIFAGVSDKQEIRQSTSAGALYEYSNQALVSRINYDYAGKYLFEAALRYEGSSKFPPSFKWATFPSFSAGWRISEEKFWKESPLKFINNFKLRGSYGIMGDDGALDYQFITGFTYPSSGNAGGLPSGSVFDGVFINGATDKGIANKALTWYESKIANFGFDADAWNGMLTVTAEYFRRDRSGLLATRVGSLPGIVGANLPQENLNSDLTQGFEIEVGHRHRIGEFSYQVKGNLSYTRTKTVYAERAKDGNSYLNWRNNTNDRYNNIWWGYEGDGRITSWNEIYNNPVYIGRGTTMGDFEYKDWNGDGWINDLDVHPLATNGLVPLINYGVTLAGEWKGIDFSLLFQGSGRRYVIPREFLYQPLWSDSNAITDFLDRWHPSDPSANPYNPATAWISGKNAYTGSLPNANSDFNIQNAAYLRLKNIEVGYTLPKKWLSKLNIQSVRVYFSAYNMLTFTKLKYADPEFYSHPSSGGLDNLGYNYPINKSMTVGLNVKF